MEFQRAIMGCCGIHGLYRIPSDFNVFKSETKRIINDNLDYSYCRYYYYSPSRRHCIKGAGIQINVAHYQTGALKYLQEIGFKVVFTYRNSNSRNIDHVLFMDRKKWNTMVGKWMREED